MSLRLNPQRKKLKPFTALKSVGRINMWSQIKLSVLAVTALLHSAKTSSTRFIVLHSSQCCGATSAQTLPPKNSNRKLMPRLAGLLAFFRILGVTVRRFSKRVLQGLWGMFWYKK